MENNCLSLPLAFSEPAQRERERERCWHLWSLEDGFQETGDRTCEPCRNSDYAFIAVVVLVVVCVLAGRCVRSSGTCWDLDASERLTGRKNI